MCICICVCLNIHIICVTEYSVSEKLNEIDVANENMHSSMDYTGKVSFFKCSEAYHKITTFIQRLNTAVRGQTIPQLCGDAVGKIRSPVETFKRVHVFPSDAHDNDANKSVAAESAIAEPASSEETTPASILSLLSMLKEVESLIAECPPADKTAVSQRSTNPLALNTTTAAAAAPPASAASNPSSAALPPGSRFGSPAFRQFLTLLNERAPAMLGRVLDTVPADVAARKWSIVDAEQSEQSRALEREGHEKLRTFRRTHDVDGKGLTSSAAGGHKLPPGVVIQHGPHGVGNGPGMVGGKGDAVVRSLHMHDESCTHGEEHDQKHEDDHEHSHDHPTKDTSLNGQRQRLISHLSRYLVQCWGDIRRLDYGTGHELHYLCLLSALGDVGVFDLSNDMHVRRVVGICFVPYVRLMRRLQSTYWLEPAGSRGVWGLDDFCFIPFLLGSAQLIGHKNIKPKSVRYPEILDGFAKDYLYLDCIQFILQVKTSSFAQHSPMLNDITIIKTWDQVNAGLWRMYEAEVLGKFAVIQHFIYSPLLPHWPREPLQIQEIKEEPPCCGDAIHFPSAIAAKQQSQPPRI
jgi:hypothetical protein